MHKKYIIAAAYLGALTVAIGAFGAHAIKDKISGDAYSIFETAVKYQFYHVFALLGAGILYNSFPNKLINASGKLFIAGIILFCGSLYLLTYFKNAGNISFDWIGAITPFGGLCFIAGWVCLAIGISKS